MNRHVLVLAEGLQTSIQDLGRKGYRSFGVPIAGAMDKYSAILANKLLNNDHELPVMEITLGGPKLLFEDDMAIAITGGDLSPMINGQPIESNMVHLVKTSDVLSFGKPLRGVRSYLAVNGGFGGEKVMNSYSYYHGITAQSAVFKGQRLPLGRDNSEVERTASKIRVKKSFYSTNKLEVTKGPEFTRLNKEQRKSLFDMIFEVDTMNDRMAYQLRPGFEGLKDGNLITSTTIPGTVQLTPSGKLIVMMRDGPTTGGYPRILQLTDMAINQLAQKKAGDRFQFVQESSFSFLNRLSKSFD